MRFNNNVTIDSLLVCCGLAICTIYVHMNYIVCIHRICDKELRHMYVRTHGGAREREIHSYIVYRVKSLVTVHSTHYTLHSIVYIVRIVVSNRMPILFYVKKINNE